MINYDRDKVCVLFADDLHDAAQFIAATPRLWNQDSAMSNRATHDWDLATGWERSLELADNGWTEGALAFANKLAVLPPNEAEPEYQYDVAGYMPDVPLYCSGDPMHMRNDGHPQGRKPIVHLVVNAIASAFITADEYRNYGAAITAMIAQIEASGRRVELDVVFVDGLRDGTKGIMGWKVKQASDHVDLSAVAYSLAHPAAFRRIGFALIERTPRRCESFGYGSCSSMTAELAHHINAEGAFLLGGVGRSRGACKTMAEALRFAAQQINAAAGEPLVTVED
jgi:hypothetical protein